MAVSKRKRNSLGALVLPFDFTDSPITWDEYKEKTGIDLHDIFECRKDGDGDEYLAFKPEGTSKVIYIALVGNARYGYDGSISPSPLVFPLSTANIAIYPDPVLADTMLMINAIEGQTTHGVSISLYGNETLSVQEV